MSPASAQYELPAEQATPLAFEDPFAGVYKKLLFSKDGSRLLGGILVGDAADYGKLLMLAKSEAPLPCQPHELIVGEDDAAPTLPCGLDAMPDSAQICSCNNVSKAAICSAIRDQGSTRSMRLSAARKPAPVAAAACRW